MGWEIFFSIIVGIILILGIPVFIYIPMYIGSKIIQAYKRQKVLTVSLIFIILYSIITTILLR
jgi:hypothetical protein